MIWHEIVGFAWEVGWDGMEWESLIGGLSFTYFIIPALHILSAAEFDENAI